MLKFLEIVGYVVSCGILLYSIPYLIIFFLFPIIIPIMVTYVLCEALQLDNPFTIFGLLIVLQLVQLIMWWLFLSFNKWLNSKDIYPYWER